ncbi:unnamed protein product [Rotaria sordida]|uniref:ATPase AAA-type core domain-containing protein n=1 Tax=Rotaria sordida TaxID=392033 RepID=A0A815YU58_9BILA|nr:unnamed protein product [Rotaria sordida]CAF1573956.1 unnamed protein product [Rotaria sordida]
MASSDIKPVANYVGAFDPVTMPYNENLASMGGCIMQPVRLYTIKYQVLPCTLIYNSLCGYGSNVGNDESFMMHTTSAIQFLSDEYKLDPNTFLSSASYDAQRKHLFYTDIYIDIGNYLSIHLSNGQLSSTAMDNPLNLKPDTSYNEFNCFTVMTIYYIPQIIDRACKILSQLINFKLLYNVETSLQMVCYTPQSGFYTSPISIKRPHIKDLCLNYGHEFADVHEKLLNQLCQTYSSGIAFLHGPPGTGKTYYIRYLINEIKNKSLIYVPPDLVNEITKPGFLPFLMQHPNSILIIEDSETIILDRKDALNPNQAVSNLLNLSDGLLGDAMHQQIITTFNCEMKGIDPALLREGRLIVEHKFEKLSVDNVRQLYKEFGIDGAENIQEPMLLAEIYAKKSVSE